MILCVGEGLIDLMPPGPESLLTASHLQIQPGGAPLNIAIGLRRLGCDSMFVGTLSRDAFGRRLCGLLEHEAVPSHPARAVDEQTRLALVDHTNREAPFRFYGDDPADAQLAGDDILRAVELTGATGLYLGSLQLTHPKSRAALEFAVDLARERNIAVYSDPNPRPAAWRSREEMVRATEYLLVGSTVAKISLDDAALLGWPVAPQELLRWAADHFPARLFITAGGDGCYALISGEVERVRPPDVTPVDPTGAGDASFAALISRFHPAKSLERADLEFAATAGALATLRPGAVNALPTLREVTEAVTG